MTLALIRLALGPVLLWQGARVRRDILRMPEPNGAREGGEGTFSLLVLGDSSAAGVGVPDQRKALSGHVACQLGNGLKWKLLAKTGWTTADALAALNCLDERFDAALLSLGVNDATTEVPVRTWLATYAELLDRLQENHGVSTVIASGLPPMGLFWAMPQPLRWYMGRVARTRDQALRNMLAARSQPRILQLPIIDTDIVQDGAPDGFPPWPRHLCRLGQRSGSAAVAPDPPQQGPRRVKNLNAQARLESERDAALAALTEAVPYNRFIGVRFDRLGDELTARLPFKEAIVGNPFLPAIHGGVTGAFLEITALMQLAWDRAWVIMEEGGEDAAAILDGKFPPMPKTIDITIDYLRSGRPRETFARARVHKAGRRVANLHVEAWQDERRRPIAALRGNFLMPVDG